MRQFLLYGHVLTTEEIEAHAEEGVPENPPTLKQFKEQVQYLWEFENDQALLLKYPSLLRGPWDGYYLVLTCIHIDNGADYRALLLHVNTFLIIIVKWNVLKLTVLLLLNSCLSCEVGFSPNHQTLNRLLLRHYRSRSHFDLCVLQIDTYEKIYEECEQINPLKVFDNWFRIDGKPFKQALLNIIKKWSYMFKQHLIDHVTNR